ncbi:MAG: thiol:disulfide interchange protein, partial [Flavobacteriales bacterium]|nr:thiol:disulfide interchange protein [Flavobacteriales bacterium]
MLKFKAILTALIAVFSLQYSVYGQIYDPVDWEMSVSETSDTEATLTFKATLEEGWHIYALDLPSDEGPLPTEFTFETSDKYELLGDPDQGKYITDYDPNFQMDLNYFADRAEFTQKIKRISPSDFSVKGELSFMVCNDEMCLPPEYIEIDLKVAGAVGNPSTDTPDEGGFGSGGQIGLNSDADSEIYDPVSWKFSVEEETDSTAVLVAEAEIDEGWHLYATDLGGAEEGPLPTEFTFETIDGFSLAGEVVSNEAKVAFDPNFEMDLAYFDGEAIFRQEVKKITGKKGEVKGYVSFMVCDDYKCLPPTSIDFTFSLKAGKASAETSETETESIGEKSKRDKRSTWGIFIIAFLSGFAALLTPCVFPMIPMTVSFFTKQSKTRAAGIRNAIIYGISIILIYVILGVVVTAVFGADVLSRMSTDPWFNVFFFLLLIVFAISFLGAFEITLPSSWINKADSKADKGGLVGIFFMA